MKKINKAQHSLISRMIMIQKLALTRSLLVHLFDELTRVLPQDIYLTGVQKTSDKMTLSGQSEAHKSVAQLIHNLEKSAWIKAPVLIEIKKNEVKKMIESSEFIISFVLPSYD
jgi:type IV pilus assembly protein PilN